MTMILLCAAAWCASSSSGTPARHHVADNGRIGTRLFLVGDHRDFDAAAFGAHQRIRDAAMGQAVSLHQYLAARRCQSRR